jgi:hypothetical protein
MLLKIRQINRRLEIAGVVSKEGKPVKHATVHLSSRDHAYGVRTSRESAPQGCGRESYSQSH